VHGEHRGILPSRPHGSTQVMSSAGVLPYHRAV
jgi:hypothetical protein